MEAKDTVMSSEQALQYGGYRYACEAQAEISFKAGYEQGRTVNRKHYLLGKGHGIREVVESLDEFINYWMNQRDEGKCDFDKFLQVLIAKLKDWKIE